MARPKKTTTAPAKKTATTGKKRGNPGKGYLSPKTYFPATGDILVEDHPEDGLVSWECVRSNTYTSDAGVKHRYALLATTFDGDDDVSLWAVTSQEMPDTLDNCVVTLKRRPSKDEDHKTYNVTDKGTYAEA